MHEWTEFAWMPEHKERDFGGKVSCFNAGYMRIQHFTYEAIGSLETSYVGRLVHFEWCDGGRLLFYVGRYEQIRSTKPRTHS